MLIITYTSTPTTKSNAVRDADGFVSASGNPTIVYDGVSKIVGAAVGAWHECRGANPADPCL